VRRRGQVDPRPREATAQPHSAGVDQVRHRGHDLGVTGGVRGDGLDQVEKCRSARRCHGGVLLGSLLTGVPFRLRLLFVHTKDFLGFSFCPLCFDFIRYDVVVDAVSPFYVV
jgi:hypothetical protein